MTRASLGHTMNHIDLLGLFRSSHQRCSVKKGTVKNFANFTGNHLCWSLFLIMLQVFRAATLLKRYSNTEFSYEICKIFKSTCFKDHLRKTASTCFTSEYYNKQWWRVWTRRDLDRVQSKYFLNVTILFGQMQPYNLYAS